MSAGKASTSSAMLIRLSCPILPKALSFERPRAPMEKESFRLGTLVLTACGVSENPTLCVLVGVAKGGGASVRGVVSSVGVTFSAEVTADDDTVLDGLPSFMGDIFKGNGALSLWAKGSCLIGVETDEADDDADGLAWPDGRYDGTCNPDVEPDPDPFVVAETDPDREARGGLGCAVMGLEVVCAKWCSAGCGRVIE